MAPTLHRVAPRTRPYELDDFGLTLPASDTGYTYIHGALFPLLIIELRKVAEREDDDLLRWFAGLPQRTLEGRRWIGHHGVVKGEAMSNTNVTPDLYGYEEFMERLLQDLEPAVRLRGLAPEQRLAGLSEAEQVLALPIHLLRALSSDYVSTLPDDIQAKIRARLLANG